MYSANLLQRSCSLAELYKCTIWLGWKCHVVWASGVAQNHGTGVMQIRQKTQYHECDNYQNKAEKFFLTRLPYRKALLDARLRFWIPANCFCPRLQILLNTLPFVTNHASRCVSARFDFSGVLSTCIPPTSCNTRAYLPGWRAPQVYHMVWLKIISCRVSFRCGPKPGNGCDAQLFKKHAISWMRPLSQ